MNTNTNINIESLVLGVKYANALDKATDLASAYVDYTNHVADKTRNAVGSFYGDNLTGSLLGGILGFNVTKSTDESVRALRAILKDLHSRTPLGRTISRKERGYTPSPTPRRHFTGIRVYTPGQKGVASATRAPLRPMSRPAWARTNPRTALLSTLMGSTLGAQTEKSLVRPLIEHFKPNDTTG